MVLNLFKQNLKHICVVLLVSKFFDLRISEKQTPENPHKTPQIPHQAIPDSTTIKSQRSKQKKKPAQERWHENNLWPTACMPFLSENCLWICLINLNIKKGVARGVARLLKKKENEHDYHISLLIHDFICMHKSCL